MVNVGGLFGSNKSMAGQQDTKTLKPGFAGLKSVWYKLTNTPYVDIVIVRDRKRIIHLVAKDTGFDMFSIPGLGTFLMPQGEEMHDMIYSGNGIYLFYRIDSQTAGQLVDQKTWATFVFPPYSPEIFQRKLESKAIADLLSEERKDMSWIIWIVILVVIIAALFLMFGGV